MNPFRRLIIVLNALILFGICQIAMAQIEDPLLIEPAPGEPVESTIPRLQWAAVSVSARYALLIDEDECKYRLEIVKKIDQHTAVSIVIENTLYDVPYYDTQDTERLEPFTEYTWRVTSFCESDNGEVISDTSERSFITGDYPWTCNKNIADKDNYDQDCDGIPNVVEEKIGTSKKEKTLFVRPIVKEPANGSGEYWNDFVETYFPQPKDSCKNRCIASIPPFEAAGIEVVVIGCEPPRPDTCPPQSYRQLYAKFTNFEYDPADPVNFDPDLSEQPNYKLPCSIMEISANPSENYCEYADDDQYAGHTHLSVSRKKTVIPSEVETEIEEEKYKEVDTYTWTWATLGYTPPNKEHHGYYIPSIYSIPIDNYFVEGAYPAIEKNMMPATTACNNMTQNTCGNCIGDQTSDCFSPTNLYGNDTVVFASVIIPDDSGQIGDVYPSTPLQYSRKDVIKRMLVHEMAHALLSATPEDHCPNPDCILYESIEDWSLVGFGENCKHFEKIREDGVILNLPHK